MQAPSFEFGRHRLQSPPDTCHGTMACQPGQKCCPDGVCRHPWQCAPAMQATAYGTLAAVLGPPASLGTLDDPDDGAEGGAWWNQCPDGMEFNFSTLQCEPTGDPATPPPQADVCPPGTIGLPPACWPVALPAQPPINVPPDVPTVTENECQARVAEADQRKWLYAGGAGVGGVLLGIGLGFLFR